MQMKLKHIVTEYHNFMIEISGFATACLIFACGIGRYRLVVVYAAYCLLKALSTFALSTFKNIEKGLNLILLPAVVVASFLDMTKGPIFPLFTINHWLIALSVLIIAAVVVRNLLRKWISNISEEELFVVCPLCNFDNKELVTNCIKCAYDISKTLDKKLPKISACFKGDKIPPELIFLLNIGESEEILYHKKLSKKLACYKNNNLIIRKHFIITTSYFILLDYKGFGFHIPKSYCEIDIVPLTNIEVVKCEMKRINISKSPFLEIKTFGEDIFGIAFSCFGNYKGELDEIVSLIKKANSQAETIMDLSEMPWKYDI